MLASLSTGTCIMNTAIAVRLTVRIIGCRAGTRVGGGPRRVCRRACCCWRASRRTCGRNSLACPIAVAWKPCTAITNRRAARCGRWTRSASKCCTATTTNFTRRPATGALATTNPIDFVGSGTIGNGHFALFLSEIASEGQSLLRVQRGGTSARPPPGALRLPRAGEHERTYHHSPRGPAARWA